MYHNSSLPKLLAKENISIRHGNYQTPWFDIKNRVLGLPLWKDMGKDVYDLFVGHEVGHALETPYEGWHDSPEKLVGCPRSYINVVEDARIERKVKSRYPGLVGPFSRAYAKLFDDNFFGTDDIDMSSLRIIDKINLQAKVGAHVELEFNDEEQVFMDRANTTEDFQEVLDLVKDIVAYDKSLEEDKDEEEDNNDDQTEEPNDDSEENDSEGYDGGDEESEEETDAPGSSDEEDEQAEEDLDEDQAPTKGSEGSVSITDEAFRSNESSLLDIDEDGRQILAVEDISKEVKKDIVIPYAELKAQRQLRRDTMNLHVVAEVNSLEQQFPKYMKDVKRSVGIAVKEFEMRKAATQWAKATTAKTGVIDVNKLYSYKTNEDIFKQTTRLHDAKSHGMIMLIDYSGSMYESLPKVLEQLIHLVLFCKQVNIPFDVYAFTTTNQKLNYYDLRNRGLLFDGDMDLDDLAMPMLTSSKLKKADFIDSIKALYLRAKGSYYVAREVAAPCEDFGSTPLNQALVMAHSLIKEFKGKNAVEKMNLVVLSDGDANRIQAFRDGGLEDNKVETRGMFKGINMRIDGKMVKAENTNNVTQALLENINKRYNTSTIGFFMADDNRMFNHKIAQIHGWDDSHRNEANKEYRKNKCVVRKSALGYDEFYLIKGGNKLAVEDDEFGVTSDQTKNQMANAFKKYSKSKKQNKVLMTTFGRIVA
jgi:hypothetical protein